MNGIKKSLRYEFKKTLVIGICSLLNSLLDPYETKVFFLKCFISIRPDRSIGSLASALQLHFDLVGVPYSVGTNLII
jgi:hypothetical protein